MDTFFFWSPLTLPARFRIESRLCSVGELVRDDEVAGLNAIISTDSEDAAETERQSTSKDENNRQANLKFLFDGYNGNWQKTKVQICYFYRYN